MVVRRMIALAGLTAAIVLLASCISVLVARSMTAAGPKAQIETTAPDFTLHDTDGNVSSLSDFRGKAVVIMFTDPRCPVTNQYSGRIMDMVAAYADEPVQFLAIASGPRVTDEAYLKELRVQRRVLGQSFPTLLDPDGRVARSFGANVTPCFYVIGRHGMLRYAGAFDDNRDSTKVRQGYVKLALDAVIEYGTVGISEIPATGCAIQP